MSPFGKVLTALTIGRKVERPSQRIAFTRTETPGIHDFKTSPAAVPSNDVHVRLTPKFRGTAQRFPLKREVRRHHDVRPPSH